MQRLPVDSSDIVSIGYDAKARVLEVEFKEGRVYQYYDVEPDVHARFMRADSYGQYFYAFVNGHYRYERVEQDAAADKQQPLTFVTHNARKMADLRAACQPFGIEAEQLALPVDEIQSHDIKKVALAKAKHACKLAGRPVLVQDEFWNVLALRGFPGAFANYIDEWLRAEDILRLMEGKQDRTVAGTETLVYYDGKRSKTFSNDILGIIAGRPRGQGPSLSQIIVPTGQTQTIAEIVAAHGGHFHSPGDGIWHDFAKWYNMQRRLGKA